MNCARPSWCSDSINATIETIEQKLQSQVPTTHCQMISRSHRTPNSTPVCGCADYYQYICSIDSYWKCIIITVFVRLIFGALISIPLFDFAPCCHIIGHRRDSRLMHSAWWLWALWLCCDYSDTESVCRCALDLSPHIYFSRPLVRCSCSIPSYRCTPFFPGVRYWVPYGPFVLVLTRNVRFSSGEAATGSSVCFPIQSD